jgi:hypothetical protein
MPPRTARNRKPTGSQGETQAERLARLNREKFTEEQEKGEGTDPTGPTGDTGADIPDASPDATPTAGTPNGTAPERKTVTTVQVREWAQNDPGITELPSHGRMPESVKAAFLAAHPDVTEIIAAKKSSGNSKSPVLKPVAVDAFESEDVPQDEWESHPLSDGPVRDASQLKVDKDVKAIHDAWIAAERPAVHDAPRKRYVVSPEIAPAMRWMLGQAGKLHDVQIKIQPVTHGADGRQVIVFTAIDKPKPVKKDEKPETAETKPETVETSPV